MLSLKIPLIETIGQFGGPKKSLIDGLCFADSVKSRDKYVLRQGENEKFLHGDVL